MKNLKQIYTATIFFIVVLLTLPCLAQDQDKGYIGLSFGSNTPMGDFGSKDGTNQNAGFANPGLDIDLSYNYKFGKNFGIAALFRYQSNPTDAQALADYLSQTTTNISSGTISSGKWGIGGYMVGGYGNFSLTDKLSLDTKIMFGILTASSPEFDIYLTGTNGNSADVTVQSASASTFAYLIGIGLKDDLGKRISLLVSIDYLSANPEFDNVETTTSLGTSSTSTIKQSFQTLTYNVGIGYRFYK